MVLKVLQMNFTIEIKLNHKTNELRLDFLTFNEIVFNWKFKEKFSYIDNAALLSSWFRFT